MDSLRRPTVVHALSMGWTERNFVGYFMGWISDKCGDYCTI